MKDLEYTYAVARIRALEVSLLTGSFHRTAFILCQSFRAVPAVLRVKKAGETQAESWMRRFYAEAERRKRPGK